MIEAGSDRVKVDALGDQCPIPVVKAKKALDHAAWGAAVEVHVDNEIAVQNLTKLARSQECECRAEKLEEKHFVVTIIKKNAGQAESGKQEKIGAAAQEPAGSSAQEEETEKTAESAEVSCQPDARDHSIVVVSSAVMGVGNDELGKVLMKGFLYGLSQLDVLPEKMLFYNGGVTLTTEGSDSLEDLKAMEAQGVQIFSCGTCLNYYGLTDKLKVGEVTNMYAIVEAMAAASKIIKP